MTLTALASVPPETFSPEDREVAREASRALSRLSGRGSVHVEAATKTAAGETARQSFVLPATAVRLLTDILVQLAEGRDVQIMRSDAALTTQQAADMLNVSRPYLVRLLAEGQIDYHMVSTHRRVLLRDLLAYRERRNLRSNAALERLAEEAQELNFGY